MMMEVGRATKSTLSIVSEHLNISVVDGKFNDEANVLNRMKEVCGAISGMMKNELIVVVHQVDGTSL